MAKSTRYPFGLRDVKLFPLSGTKYGDSADLPSARVMTFTPGLSSDMLQGDGRIVAAHSREGSVTWELEGGGVPVAVWETLTGATASDSAAMPNELTYMDITRVLTRPYFGVVGRAITVVAENVYLVIPKAKCTDGPSGHFEGGTFHLTGASGRAVPDSTGVTWRMAAGVFIQGYSWPDGDDLLA